jgi:phage shock protein A
MEPSLENAKAKPDKTWAGLEEMEAAVEPDLEEMKDRIDVFEEKLDKMDAAKKACLG